MDSSQVPEVSLEVPPYARVLKDGTIERLAGTQTVPAGLDPQTGVLSKDMVIFPQTGVSARLYRPNITETDQKLPLIVYYHGGAFCIASAADPLYHNTLNLLVAETKAIAVSVNYRLAPEHPLPIAYEDSWAALQWVFGGEDRSPSLDRLACGKVLVLVAGNDILRDRGRLYYDELVKSNWAGSKQFIETEGEDHVFHIFNPNCEKAKSLIDQLLSV